MAFATILNLCPHGRQTLGQRFGLFFIAFKEVQHQPEGGFLPNSRQFRNLVYCVFYEFGWILQENYEL